MGAGDISLLGPFVVIGVVMVTVLGALFFFVGRNMMRAASPEGRAKAVASAEAWVAQKTAELAPWGPGSIVDISRFVSYGWTRTANEETRGVVEAVSSKQPIVAFATIWGLSGRHVFARTTAHQWRIEVEGGALSPSEAFRIALDGAPFGTWRPGDGVLLDAGGAEVGFAKRGLTTQINDIPTNWSDKHFAVTLRGREVGAILAQRGAKHMNWLTGSTKVPVVALPDATLPSDLSSETERWLLALAIIEIAFVQVARSAGTGLGSA